MFVPVIILVQMFMLLLSVPINHKHRESLVDMLVCFTDCSAYKLPCLLKVLPGARNSEFEWLCIW